MNIEDEFGVPMPGEIVAEERWTRTALKKLPLPGPLDRAAIFGRTAPLVVDIGCGNGRFLLASALQHPDWDHVGVDILPLVLRYATRRANQRGLANIRFAAIDGQRFVGEYLTGGGIHEIHCYHPQPHHDRRQIHHRLWTPTFMSRVSRALQPGGTFFAQTDNVPYWEYLLTIAPAFFEFKEQVEPWPDAAQGRTRREILARRRGLPVHRGWGVARPWDKETAVRLIRELRLPTFDAGPRPTELDEEEHE